MPRVQLNELGNLTDLLGVAGHDDLHGIVDEYRITYSTADAIGDRLLTFPTEGDIRRSRALIGRSARASLPELLLVTTRFIVDDRGPKLEVSRRIRNISRAPLWIYKIEMQIDLRYFTPIRSTLNLNPPPERIGPPDHQPNHCLKGDPSCLLPSSRPEGERQVYHWPDESGSPFPVRLGPGRETLARLTYVLRRDV